MEYTDELARKYAFHASLYRTIANKKNSAERKKYVTYANTLKKTADLLEKTGHIGRHLEKRAKGLVKRLEGTLDFE